MGESSCPSCGAGAAGRYGRTCRFCGFEFEPPRQRRRRSSEPGLLRETFRTVLVASWRRLPWVVLLAVPLAIATLGMLAAEPRVVETVPASQPAPEAMPSDVIWVNPDPFPVTTQAQTSLTPPNWLLLGASIALQVGSATVLTLVLLDAVRRRRTTVGSLARRSARALVRLALTAPFALATIVALMIAVVVGVVIVGLIASVLLSSAGMAILGIGIALALVAAASALELLVPIIAEESDWGPGRIGRVWDLFSLDPSWVVQAVGGPMLLAAAVIAVFGSAAQVSVVVQTVAVFITTAAAAIVYDGLAGLDEMGEVPAVQHGSAGLSAAAQDPIAWRG